MSSYFVRTCHFPLFSAEPRYQNVRIDPGIIVDFWQKYGKIWQIRTRIWVFLVFSHFRFLCLFANTIVANISPPPSPHGPHGGGGGGPRRCGRPRPFGGRPRGPRRRRWPSRCGRPRPLGERPRAPRRRRWPSLCGHPRPLGGRPRAPRRRRWPSRCGRPRPLGGRPQAIGNRQ